MGLRISVEGACPLERQRMLTLLAIGVHFLHSDGRAPFTAWLHGTLPEFRVNAAGVQSNLEILCQVFTEMTEGEVAADGNRA